MSDVWRGIGIVYRPQLLETLIVPATDPAGATSVGSYGSVRLVVTGICSFFGGAFSDAEVSFGPALGGEVHGEGIFFWLGGMWVHVEPVGGPYSTQQPGNEYEFLIDFGGAQITARFDDSVYEDNGGEFEVAIYAV